MNSQATEQGSSVLTRLQAWVTALPLVTKSVLALCVLATTLAAGIGPGTLHHLCLNAYFTVFRLQLYRLVTSLFLHAGLLHLAFNMLAFVPISRALENQFGSIFILYLVGIIGLISSTVYILSSAVSDSLYGVQSCAVGFSGVIFGLIVIETHTSNVQQRSIFGIFTVPAQYYALALLVVCQLLFPHVSFWGHLGGIVAGQLLIWGALNFAVPSPSRLQVLENVRPFRSISLWPSFVQNASTGPIFAREPSLPTSFAAGGVQTNRNIWQEWWNWAKSLLPAQRAPTQQGTQAGQASSSSAYRMASEGQRPASQARWMDPKMAAAKAAEDRLAKSVDNSADV